MIEAKKIIKKQNNKILKTTNYPKITGIVYKLRGEIGETLYVSYDKIYGVLRYVGKDLFNSLSKIETKEELTKELTQYRSLHDTDYNKTMKPYSFTNDYTENDLIELNKYHF